MNAHKAATPETKSGRRNSCLTVLLVEDDKPLRKSLAQSFELAELDVIEAGTVIEAEDHISPSFKGVVVSDIRLPGKDGFDLLLHARKTDPDLPVILLTGAGDIPMAVRAMNEGASEFLEKPCHPDELVTRVRRWLKSRALIMENRALQRRLEQSDVASRLFPGVCAAVKAFRTRLREYAEMPAHLHLFGSEGVGKTAACQAVHALSNTYGEQIFLTAAEISDETLADAAMKAKGGTLVFEHIDQADAARQELIRRFVEKTGEVRTVSTSRKALDELAKDGGFSPKLYFALNVLVLGVPDLSARQEDLPDLFATEVMLFADQINRTPPALSANDRAAICASKWPGNLPQLRAVAQRFALGLDPGWREGESANAKPGLAEQMSAFERIVIVEALQTSQGKTERAAQQLSIPVQTLYDKLKKHGLKASEFRRKQN